MTVQGTYNAGFQNDIEISCNGNTKIVDISINGAVPETSDKDQPPTTVRGTWGRGIEFLMSCIAMNVGFGNIWRFPFVAYENGGGAFLILYICVLIVVGRPMYYLEMTLGQFCSRGNVKMFESLAPALKGIGYGQLIGAFAVGTYLCSLIAITLFYLVNSFTSNLPWAECNPEWQNSSWLANTNIECVASKSENVSGTAHTISSSELWFKIEVLKEIPDISDGIGVPEWRLTLCLFVSWCTCCILCIKGVKSSGKSSYFLAIFPYVILITMLVRSVTLDGAVKGILYYISPKWEMLLQAKVWYSALTQCFFSLNIGFGSITMYASYNRFRHNCYRDAMIVATLDTFTSFLAGLIIFGILGNLAQKMGVEVTEVVTSGGTGLAFISYPEAVARFEAVPWLFSILFFLMLFVLGIGCMLGLQGCAFTVIMDAFPHLKMWQVSSFTCAIGFLIGLVFITPGGQWIFTMVDFFLGSFIFLVLTILQLIVVFWWYGLSQISLDIEFMLKRKPSLYFRICWTVIIPILLLLVLGYFVVTWETIKYEKKEYPPHILSWGWAIFIFSVLQPIIWFVISLVMEKRKLGFNQVLQKLFSHSNWGPKDPQENIEWHEFKEKARQCRASFNRHWLLNKLYTLIGKI